MKDLFNDFLDETKGFKYEITVKILLKKYKSTEIEFSPVYFNSMTKIVIKHKFDLEKVFQEILYSTKRWVNEASDWNFYTFIGEFLHQITC